MCDCEVCVRHREFEARLARVPEEDREFFRVMAAHIDDVEMDRDYYKAIVRNTWPGADRVLARYRCAKPPGGEPDVLAAA